MTTNLDLAKTVAMHVQLHGVALQKAAVASAVDTTRPPQELELQQSHRASYQRAESSPEWLEVYLDFDFRARDSQTAETPLDVVDLHATFVLRYSVPAEEEFSPEALAQFAWLNGSYNAWPYWRELVQTVTGRVGLSAITVPVYRPKVEKVPSQVPAVAT